MIVNVLIWIIAVAAAYLIGAVPFGYLLVRWKTGRDVRAGGSGNIGATNVLRTTGRGLGLLTLLLDAAKGAAGVVLAARLLPGEPLAPWLAGLAAVLGHIFSLYLRFRGGKGVATCLGVFIVLSPRAVLVSLAVFLFVVVLTRLVAAGSVSAATIFPPAAWWLEGIVGIPLICGLACSAAVIWSHRENLRRIAAGNEHRLWGRRRSDVQNGSEGGGTT